MKVFRKIIGLCLSRALEWTPELLRDRLCQGCDTIESFKLAAVTPVTDTTAVYGTVRSWCRTILAFPNLKHLRINSRLAHKDLTEVVLTDILREREREDNALSQAPRLLGSSWLEPEKDHGCVESPKGHTGIMMTTLHYRVIPKPTFSELAHLLDSVMSPLATVYTNKDVIRLTWSYL